MQTKTFTITKIPANSPVKKAVRVAAYARVSADKDAAFHSLEQQVDYYDDFVTVHPDWELVQIYSDSAISGTKEDRPSFQQMLTDCRAGKIDLVVTKSITRFARNTVVLLETIRELKGRDIDVYFEKEDMHSISPDGELLLTLLAMYAEEEARSASENQKWRIKRKFEQGQTTLGRMLGYRLKDGVLTVVPEEAELVKKIFAEFIAGDSIGGIAKELNREKIPAAYSDVWNRSSVYAVLANEKYTGNMILQKTYCEDFRTKKQVINKGQVPKYQVSCRLSPTTAAGTASPLEPSPSWSRMLPFCKGSRCIRTTWQTAGRMCWNGWAVWAGEPCGCGGACAERDRRLRREQ